MNTFKPLLNLLPYLWPKGNNNFKKRLEVIKNKTNLPIIIFPGDSNQISKTADAVLFLSLLSGRNSKYLIEEQVASSKKIYNYELEVIPTGYLLLKTDKKSAVEIISNNANLIRQDFGLPELDRGFSVPL